MSLDLFLGNVPNFPEAVCRDSKNPDLWFPEDARHTEDIALAKSLCGACPQQLACLQYALDEQITEGIWGGMTQQERRGISRKKGRPRQPSKTGERVEQMRNSGLSYKQIAYQLDSTPNAVQAAYLRYIKRTRGTA